MTAVRTLQRFVQEVAVTTLSEIEEREIRERRTMMFVASLLCAVVVGVIVAIVMAYQ